MTSGWNFIATGNRRLAFLAFDLLVQTFLSEVVKFLDFLDDPFRIVQRNTDFSLNPVLL